MRRIYAPYRADAAAVAALRDSGRIVISGLPADAEPRGEARRLGCADILVDGAVHPVD
jgi:hypothetical protein